MGLRAVFAIMALLTLTQLAAMTNLGTVHPVATERRKVGQMNRRIEYWHDDQAPRPNSLVPASNLLVANDSGQILLQRRRDTGQWALPGGKQDIGETPSQCAVRESAKKKPASELE